MLTLEPFFTPPLEQAMASAPEESHAGAAQGPMDLVRHMLNVIENQQAQIAQLRAENAELRARLSNAPAAAAEAAPPRRDETARTTSEALASLIDLSNGRAHAAPVQPAAGEALGGVPSWTKRPLEAGGELDQPARHVVARPAQVVQAEAWQPGSAQPVMVRPMRAPTAKSDGDASDRQCVQCGTRESPKWRNGNTLCNACGIRNAKQVREGWRRPQPLLAAMLSRLLCTGAQAMNARARVRALCHQHARRRSPTRAPVSCSLHPSALAGGRSSRRSAHYKVVLRRTVAEHCAR